jgi:3-hydroxybutyryl-CoA dehydrogenase
MSDKQPFQTVGVIGAGTMGSGIAQVCAQNGYPVVVYDISVALLEKASLQVAQQLKALEEKGRITAAVREQVEQRIRWCSALEDVKAGLIIEAVVEKLEVKQNLLATLEEINQGSALLATNTSSIPVTRIAAALKNPANCAGLHFFNPAPVMKLVEIVSGAATAGHWITALTRFVASLGKISVVAKDSPGFIVNRVARPFYTEALQALEEAVADVESIDALMKSAGFKLGPFELMDLIGVDTNLSVTQSIWEGFYHPARFRPSRTQQQLVDAGYTGRKTGRGFYDYQGNG